MPTRRNCLRHLAAGALAAPGLQVHAASLCLTGRRQSPIDITEAQPAPAQPLSLHYAPQPLRWVHDGHTIRIRLAHPANHALLGTERLALQQTHFHLPGGDTLHGEVFPLAMHWPHKSPSGQLVTLVVWFRQGAAHPALQALLAHLPEAGQPERTEPGQVFDPNAWWPTERSYLAYEGSLTSAPCTEGVRWVVLQTPLSASAEQLAALRARIAPNARAVQPRNGRVIRQVG